MNQIHTKDCRGISLQNHVNLRLFVFQIKVVFLPRVRSCGPWYCLKITGSVDSGDSGAARAPPKFAYSEKRKFAQRFVIKYEGKFGLCTSHMWFIYSFDEKCSNTMNHQQFLLCRTSQERFIATSSFKVSNLLKNVFWLETVSLILT